MEIYGENDVLLDKKWAGVLEASDGTMNAMTKHSDLRYGVARMLENTKNFLAAQRSAAGFGMFAEATPTGQAGAIAGYDTVMLNLVRRVGPTILGNQLIGVQPMNGPTGLVFALRSRYINAAGNETNDGAPDHTFTGVQSDAAQGGGGAPVAGDQETNPFAVGFAVGGWTTTATGEGDITRELTATVDSVPVAAKTRTLKASFSLEQAQDLASQHGVDANSMYGSLMADEISAEINYETLRLIYFSAVHGAQDATVAGTYDLNADTDGRWVGEKGKILAMRIQKEASIIMQNTRMGHGNFVVCDNNVFTLLSNAGYITPAGPSNGMFAGSDTIIKDATVSRGKLFGQIDVYRDDYAIMPANEGFFVIGWKGNDVSAAGMFYTPYVPVWSVETVDPSSGQPIRFMKTRAGRVAHPMAETSGAVNGANTNPFYRIVKVTNIQF